jgi:hypothetical protein
MLGGRVTLVGGVTLRGGIRALLQDYPIFRIAEARFQLHWYVVPEDVGKRRGGKEVGEPVEFNIAAGADGS